MPFSSKRADRKELSATEDSLHKKSSSIEGEKATEYYDNTKEPITSAYLKSKNSHKKEKSEYPEDNSPALGSTPHNHPTTQQKMDTENTERSPIGRISSTQYGKSIG
mmetsp:Transcript_11507/g.17327  ORF Transcript_11507/g.17327 Transcript_11507/m.17327 type:complete len:107 (+) Transcript_11507:1563-1883(+)